MSDKEDSDSRKIEKRRSWTQINSLASSDTDTSVDDYALELDLFELGKIDKSLWAKHLVEAEGDAEKAKWQYIKTRVNTAPARRAEQQEAVRKAAEEAERRRLEQQEAERKAAEEAERRRLEQQEAERKAVLRKIGQTRVRKYEERERAGLVVESSGAGCLLALFAGALLMIWIAIT